MLLRETLWEIFFSTGNIDAYLAYRACSDCHCSNQQQSDDEPTQSLLAEKYSSKDLLREVKWH
ncbi:YqzL family protein [Sporomusa ovata]|uniref:YqzL-like protein n=1 Tax=Sporomusa ovata TaxID=2378 RepID=A0A0U1L2K9_9FIRM|nr:YqzL family protein [Sporomusa ovata]CQR73927.1 hypothetical protein SpAn4DRAFT_0389 [Sporomusa ovata]